MFLYPICEPWRWNMNPNICPCPKSPSFVGKYTIHGAYGSGKSDPLKKPPILGPPIRQSEQGPCCRFVSSSWQGQLPVFSWLNKLLINHFAGPAGQKNIVSCIVLTLCGGKIYMFAILMPEFDAPCKLD